VSCLPTRVELDRCARHHKDAGTSALEATERSRAHDKEPPVLVRFFGVEPRSHEQQHDRRGAQVNDPAPNSEHHKRFQKVADQTAAKEEHESAFQRLADWTSAAMGRPTNIMVWLFLVVVWTVIFAAKIVPANGSFLPAWFTGQGFNFPLNLITTVAELFIGFLVAAAANRAQRVLEGVIDGIRTVLDHVAATDDKLATALQQNTQLTVEVHNLAKEIHEHVMPPTQA
jgi:low affinity Fe/Cu permease